MGKLFNEVDRRIYYLDLDMNDDNGAITDPFVGPAPTPGAEAGLFNPYRSDTIYVCLWTVDFPLRIMLILR